MYQSGDILVDQRGVEHKVDDFIETSSYPVRIHKESLTVDGRTSLTDKLPKYLLKGSKVTIEDKNGKRTYQL